jgi:glycosyltransferase involved in cell wall biosynthesis
VSIKVSIIIKALNEQSNIERALRSALAAAEAVDGEVILADSYSTDQTIDIAKQFAVKIVQLNDPCERSCGIGAQLGYQYAQGEFIYILDADMEININFLQQAIVLMTEQDNLAGVGGQVEEMHLDNLEFQARVQRAPEDMRAGEVDHLAMGGLYRRSAIDQVGYLTNRNLHSYEEFELGIRLRATGWRLIRLPVISVKHYGHTMPAYRLLKKRWSSRYAQGVGELIRASLGKAHMSLLLKELTELKLYAGVFIWWIALLSTLAMVHPWTTAIFLFITLLGLPFAAMIVKKRDISLGIYAVIAWQYFTAGLLLGLLRKQAAPSAHISSTALN